MGWRTRANLDWLSALPGVHCDHPLARHTSLNVGGPGEFFVETASPAVLAEECHLRGLPYLLLGAGTNLLVADAGVEGLVIRCVNRAWKVDGRRVRAEAGLKMMRLARICAEHDLAGFEWAIGVPGTVGGAVYQNAGCWGTELVEVLVQAEGAVPARAPRSGRRTSSAWAIAPPPSGRGTSPGPWSPARRSSFEGVTVRQLCGRWPALPPSGIAPSRSRPRTAGACSRIRRGTQQAAWWKPRD
jgi:FAD binding domain